MGSTGTGKSQTYSRRFVYTDRVLRHKPIRRVGEDIRDFPTYTLPEVAISLGIPTRTLHAWFSGRHRLLKPSGHVAGLPLLSFNNTLEAYAIFLMRSYHKVSMQSIRRALQKLPKYTRKKSPLISDNLKVLERSILYDKPARGKNERRVVNLSKSEQYAIPHVVDIWAKRVAKDASGKTLVIFPWRFWEKDGESKPVQIDPAVMSGRLVITGTRIPVSLIVGRRKAGESAAVIAADYRLPVDRIEKALQHVDKKAA